MHSALAVFYYMMAAESGPEVASFNLAWLCEENKVGVHRSTFEYFEYGTYFYKIKKLDLRNRGRKYVLSLYRYLLYTQSKMVFSVTEKET